MSATVEEVRTLMEQVAAKHGTALVNVVYLLNRACFIECHPGEGSKLQMELALAVRARIHELGYTVEQLKAAYADLQRANTTVRYLNALED